MDAPSPAPLATPRSAFAVPQHPVASRNRKVVPALNMGAVPRYEAASRSGGEQEEMPTPYGYEDCVDIEDQRSKHVRDIVMDITAMSGEDGLRHMEIRPNGNTHYRIISVGISTPTTIDDMLALLFHPDGSKRTYVEDVYINPSIATGSLHSKWEHNVRDAPSVSALVVKIPTRAFVERTHVSSLNSFDGTDLNGNSAVIAELFPDIVDSGTGKLRSLGSLLKAKDHILLSTIYSAGRGECAQVECMIRDGSMSPRQRALPSMCIPLLSEQVIGVFDGDSSRSTKPSPSGHAWRSPVPRGQAYAQEFNPFVTAQIDTMFKYMCMLHVKPGEGHSIRDIPKELRLSRAEPFNRNAPVYVCQASGYSDRITLVDMLRLYLCDSVHIKDVRFDYNFKPKDTSMAHGALTVLLQTEIKQTRNTIVRRHDDAIPADQDDPRALVSLRRVRPPEPATSLPEPSPAAHPSPNEFRMISNGQKKRKAEEASPPPARKSPREEEISEVEPPAPDPVHEITQEQQQQQQQQQSVGHDRESSAVAEPDSKKAKPDAIVPAVLPVASPQAPPPPPPRIGLMAWLFASRKTSGGNH
jgi:hypothetical protein